MTMDELKLLCAKETWKERFCGHKDVPEIIKLSDEDRERLLGDLFCKTIDQRSPFMSEFHKETEKRSICLIWRGFANRSGYGVVSKKKYGYGLAHVAAFYIFYRFPCPFPGKFILHRCNTSLCINPDHLYEGTPQDNANDRKKFEQWRTGLHCQA